MPRLARVVIPSCPHHITQRGHRRPPTFFTDDDYEAYLDLMAERCADCGVEVANSEDTILDSHAVNAQCAMQTALSFRHDREIRLDFDGGQITSDAGLIALRGLCPPFSG